MPIVVSFAVHAELSIVIGEDIRSWAEIKLLEDSLHPANVLPHHIFATDLEGLWEVVKLLVLCGFLQVFRLGLPSPLHVPLGAIRSNDAHTSCLQCVDN